MPKRTRDGQQGPARRPLRGAEVRLRVVGQERLFTLRGPCRTIGSAPENDLVLDDPYVSRCHFALCWRGDDAVWIKDEKSRNGTLVNNVRVDECALEAGALISVGRTTIELLAGDERRSACPGFIGEHPRARKVLEAVERFGPRRYPVLILGETGTGKELVARGLHEASGCAAGPFEAVNCGAIPQELAESELFGHVKGAFTGAQRSRAGAFERADGGTLFLDEIGDLALALQAKLLRALEEQAILPIGAQEVRPVAIRVLAATNRDLEHDVGRGRFRRDLFHRLAVCVIRLPPLRHRRSDIPLLVRHFLALEGPGVRLEDDVLPFLEGQPWTGNVRALRGAVQRAVTEGGAVLTLEDFASATEELPRPREQDFVKIAGRSFAEIQRDVYRDALRRHGSRSAAAAALRIPKSTFFDHLRNKGFGLNPCGSDAG